MDTTQGLIPHVRMWLIWELRHAAKVSGGHAVTAHYRAASSFGRVLSLAEKQSGGRLEDGVAGGVNAHDIDLLMEYGCGEIPSWMGKL